MKPRTWILIIVVILFLALTIVGYFLFKVISENNLSKKLANSLDLTVFYVDIRDYGFMPEHLNIKVGEGVVWKNLGAENHSIIFPKMNWNSKVLVSGANYSVVFNYSGNFTYGCGIHPEKLGRIIVE